MSWSKGQNSEWIFGSFFFCEDFKIMVTKPDLSLYRVIFVPHLRTHFAYGHVMIINLWWYEFSLYYFRVLTFSNPESYFKNVLEVMDCHHFGSFKVFFCPSILIDLLICYGTYSQDMVSFHKKKILQQCSVQHFLSSFSLCFSSFAAQCPTLQCHRSQC